MLLWWWLIVGTTLIASSPSGAYQILHDYSGKSFFDGWDFYGGFDNLTWGNVTWVSKEVAFHQNLAYVTNDNHVILKVDNFTNVQPGQLRNSIRITTQAAYDFGSLWIIDLNHIPWGCSVWPAFWSFGPKWPDDGEIDIIEGINLNANNQMAIHTTAGCYHNGSADQLGSTDATDCSQAPGCTVEETSPNSYLNGFGSAGGGVFATQFETSGIFIWFWSRPDIPSSISQANSTSPMNTSSWGKPHAAYLNATCKISQFFSPQNLVLDIDLCGVWAGLPSAYSSQCGNAGSTGNCYNDCVVGPGSPKYDNAYFDINYIRTYTSTAGPAATAIHSTVPGSQKTGQPLAGESSGVVGERDNLMVSLMSLLAVLAGTVFLTW